MTGASSGIGEASARALAADVTDPDMTGGLLGNQGGSVLNAHTPGAEVVGLFGFGGQWDMQLSRGEDPSSTTVHVDVSAFNDSNSSATGHNGQCHISAVVTRVP